MLHRPIMIALAAATLSAGAPDRPAEDPEAAAAVVARYTGMSQAMWPAGLPDLHAAMRGDPRGVIEALVARLDDGERIDGSFAESTHYTRCGNALTLLERLTDERLCGLGSEWIGFSTHDHRTQAPDPAHLSGPWRAWLDVRRGALTFHGLTYPELEPLQRLVRTGSPTAEDLAYARELGPRAWPYLLAMLEVDDFGWPRHRIADGADAALRLLTGWSDDEAPPKGPIVHALLLPADHPDRVTGAVGARNRAWMARSREEWTARLIGALAMKR